MSNRRIDDEKLDKISGGVRPENTEVVLSLNPEERLKEKVDLEKELTVRLRTDIIKEDAPAMLADPLTNSKFIKENDSLFGKLLRKFKIKNLKE